MKSTDKIYIINKTKKPKMTHPKATWDYVKVILPDGKETKGHLDTTWGEYVYWQMPNGQWYKTKIFFLDNKEWQRNVLNLPEVLKKGRFITYAEYWGIKQ
jgi:hypothetical protein